MIVTESLEFVAVDLTRPGEPPNSGCMVAWVASPDVAQKLALDHLNAEPACSMHLTFSYLGKAVELGESNRSIALSTVRSFARSFGAFSARVSGTGMFDTKDGPCLVALIDAPELPGLYHDLCAALEAVGLPVSHDHGFQPHITLAYLPSYDSAPRAPVGFEFEIDNLSLVVSDEGESFRLK